MPKKSQRKKRQFQQFCREQVKRGLINQADGTWRPADSRSTMDNSMIAGYKLGRL